MPDRFGHVQRQRTSRPEQTKEPLADVCTLIVPRIDPVNRCGCKVQCRGLSDPDGLLARLSGVTNIVGDSASIRRIA